MRRLLIVTFFVPSFMLAGTLVAASALAGGWLGVTVHPPQGVQVAEIFKDSPADRHGLQRGDVIHRVNGLPLRSTDHFFELIATLPADKEVTMTILRQGKTQELTVTLDNDEEHRFTGQDSGGTAGRWQQRPSERGAFLSSARPRNTTTSFAPMEPWASYRPPREMSYLPPGEPSYRTDKPAAWLGIAPGVAVGGVAIMGVAPDSPAEQADMKIGDIITAINRQAVTSPEVFVQRVRLMQPGDLLEVSLLRDGRSHMLQLQSQKAPVNP